MCRSCNAKGAVHAAVGGRYFTKGSKSTEMNSKRSGLLFDFYSAIDLTERRSQVSVGKGAEFDRAV